MLLCKPLDFASHNIHLQVSVEGIVSNVPGCIDYVPEYFVFWNRCIMSVLLCLVHRIPYVGTGFGICEPSESSPHHNNGFFCKGKVWTGPEGSRMLKLQDFKTVGTYIFPVLISVRE